jgi:hypothetical protein
LWAFELQPIPESEFRLAIFLLRRFARLTERIEWTGQVEETVLEALQGSRRNSTFLLDTLVELDSDQTRNDSSSSGQSGNNTAGNLFSLHSVRLRDVVVLGTQVRSGSNEFDVMIGVVVLLEIDHLQRLRVI